MLLREDVQHLPRRVAAGDALGIGRKLRQIAIPAGGQLAPLHLVDLARLLRIFFAVGGEEFGPLPDARAAPRAPMPGVEMLADAVRHEELRVLRPAVGALGEPHLVVAERLAVRRGGVVPIRRTVADVAVENDDRRAPARFAEHAQRALDRLDVVGVADAQDVPAVTQEAQRDVLGERDVGAAFDRDVIVVVDPAQVVEREMARERRRFRAHALHQAAVAADRVDVVVEEVESDLVVARSEPALADRHPDAGRDALARADRWCVSTPDTQ